MFKRTGEGQKGLKNTVQGKPYSFLAQASTAKTNTTDDEKLTINNSLCSAWFDCSDGGTISVYLMYGHFRVCPTLPNHSNNWNFHKGNGMR